MYKSQSPYNLLFSIKMSVGVTRKPHWNAFQWGFSIKTYHQCTSI